MKAEITKRLEIAKKNSDSDNLSTEQRRSELRRIIQIKYYGSETVRRSN